MSAQQGQHEGAQSAQCAGGKFARPKRLHWMRALVRMASHFSGDVDAWIEYLFHEC
jgi:hypothetical protein